MKTKEYLILLIFVVFGGFSQNFSFVQISDMHIGYGEDMIPYYKDTVDKVNSLIEEHDIRFALITGDWGHHALKSELDEAVNNITTKLKIPYYPMLGNHDIATDHKKTIPHGDYRFMKKFEPLFESKEIKYYTGKNPVHYHMGERVEYLQNYQIDFLNQQFVVLMLDWNNRETNSSLRPGNWAAANLHNYTGGTLPWLEKRLSEISLVNAENPGKVKLVVMVQHHPFACPFHFHCGKESFTDEMLAEIEKVIRNSGISLDVLWGDLSGHIHLYWFYDYVFEEFGNNFKEYTDSATRMSSAFAVIKVENWDLKTAYQYCVDCPKEGQLTVINLK